MTGAGSAHRHAGGEEHAHAGGRASPHAHGHAHGMIQRGEESSRLVWVLVFTGLFMVAEVAGGLLSRSLALLADAGHMLTDVGALALSLVAMRFARRAPSPEKTYGYVRLEILAALVNGATLLVIAGVILLEAWNRLHDPLEVDGPLMMVVATLGLGVNIGALMLLHRHAGENLNVRGAYLHVMGDLLGSVGAIGAGLVILTTGWMPADPIISVAIAGLILVGAWNLVREATDILLEAAPRHIDVEEVVAELSGIQGLEEVHDVHVWTLTSGFVALSAHGVVDEPKLHRGVLDEVQRRMRARGIEHVTFQIEPRPLYQLPRREKPNGGLG